MDDAQDDQNIVGKQQNIELKMLRKRRSVKNQTPGGPGKEAAQIICTGTWKT